MASRPRGKGRHESDAMESIKPLIVLGLLGIILYGAWTVVRGGAHSLGPADATDPWNTHTPGNASTVAVPVEQVPQGLFPQSQVLLPQSNESPNTRSVTGSQPSDFGQTPVSQIPAVGVPTQPAFAVPALPQAMGNAATAPQSLPPSGLPENLSGASKPPIYLSATATVPPGTVPPTEVSGLSSTRSQALPPQPLSPPPEFTSAWNDAHEKLAAGRYAEALAVLSVWHDDPSLGLEESQQLEELLAQLAGTTIYSREDLLLPPHIVAPGDTLQTIAEPLSVPWQLLAKINGVDDPDKLVQGEPIKLVRGPFDAVVSVSRRRLTLQVGGNYAGGFLVGIGRDVQQRIGSSFAVVSNRKGHTGNNPSVQQVTLISEMPSPAVIALSGGVFIEAVDDPVGLGDAISPTSVVVQKRDFAELIDILCKGSNILVRR
ncbi:MAG: LysM peptidoglycan-binding domain-containing protein [Pirellulales bacterium]|nr:LysM peptidoglycan-binding domain-containing protein [Pirellulales bacterium]